jgi:hypothetical protein
VNPTNPKAVGAGAGRGSLRVSGSDTEAGVKKWMAKLESALKGVNPMPITVNAESQDASMPPVSVALIIEGYRPAGAGVGGSGPAAPPPPPPPPPPLPPAVNTTRT